VAEPIEPPPRRGALAAVRRGAAWVVFVLALAVAVGVVAQVYLIGAYIFGAGAGALDAHEGVGFSVHGLEVLVLIAALVAWRPRIDLLVALALAVIGTLQISLAQESKWVGALHPLLALVVLVLAAILVRRGPPWTRRAATP
jgi:hypothetical protein